MKKFTVKRQLIIPIMIGEILCLAVLAAFLIFLIQSLFFEDKQPHTFRFSMDVVESVNPLTWENEEQRIILSFTTSPLYTEINTGEEIMFEPYLAEDLPVDVTAQYAGDERYGIPEDATEGYAFRLAIRKDALWEDGTPVTAADVSYSLRQLLSADCPHGADYQNAYAKLAVSDSYLSGGYRAAYDAADGYADVSDEDLYFSLTAENALFGTCSLEEYYAYYMQDRPALFFDEEGRNIYEELQRLSDGQTYVPLTEESRTLLLAFCKNYGLKDEQNYLRLCFYRDEEATFEEQVGFLAKYDRTMIFILEESTTMDAFLYMISDLLLVREDFYDQDPDAYGTSPETSLSYGPYTITEMNPDGIRLVKNGNWFGYADEAFDGQYSSTAIEISFGLSTEEIAEKFAAGELDAEDAAAAAYKAEDETEAMGTEFAETEDVTAEETKAEADAATAAADAAKVEAVNAKAEAGFTDANGQTLEADEQAADAGSVKAVGMAKAEAVNTAAENTEEEADAADVNAAQEGVTESRETHVWVVGGDVLSLSAKNVPGENHAILAYKDFGRAIYWAVDRSAYAQTVGTGNTPAFGLISLAYSTGLFDGTVYRETDEARGVLQSLCGEPDEDGLYAAYDPQKAGTYLQAAYDVCLMDGNIGGTDRVVIAFYSANENGAAFLQEALDAAAEGTDLEGRITVRTVDKREEADLYECCIFGRERDIGSVLRSYLTPDVQNGWAPGLSKCSMTIDGEKISMTYRQWYRALVGGEYASAPTETRVMIAASLEKGVLSSYQYIPLYTTVAQMQYSQRLVVPEGCSSVTDAVRYASYTQNDREWKRFCRRQRRAG